MDHLKHPILSSVCVSENGWTLGLPQKGYFDAENDDKTAQFWNPFVACLTAEVAGDISHKWDIIKDTLSFLKAHGANMCRHPG